MDNVTATGLAYFNANGTYPPNYLFWHDLHPTTQVIRSWQGWRSAQSRIEQADRPRSFQSRESAATGGTRSSGAAEAMARDDDRHIFQSAEIDFP
jgi:phospholipase/lecithinase/hemolysin